MNTAAEVLLIIVSAVLAIFLIFAIIALVYIIKIAKRVNAITQHAENVAESMESAAYTFKRAASPLAFLKIVGSIVENASRSRRKKG
jgi:uncharacterized membrane protein